MFTKCDQNTSCVHSPRHAFVRQMKLSIASVLAVTGLPE